MAFTIFSAKDLNAQLFEKGLESYHERDYKKAKKQLSSAFWKDQNYASAYYLGEIHRKHFEFEKALEWHRIAMEHKAQLTFWGYCLSLMQEDRIEDAKRFAKQKLLLNPNDKDLPNIITACERLERKVASEDSVTILDPHHANRYFHHKSFKEHSNNEIYHLQKPKYTFSSIYHEEMYSIILRQEPKHYDAVGTLKGYGTKLKGSPMSYYILEDGADVSYLVYANFLKEHSHDNHYNGVENYYVEVTDGEISNIEGSKIFKNDRPIKYPSISPDGKIMIFSTNKLRDSYGGYDLYKSVYHFPNWSNPENLGPKVNTAGDEIYPFISRDEKLYFSSDGLGAYGDQDVFVTSLNGYKNNEARPLEATLNSRFDDFAYLINSQSGLGMFLSNRAQKTHPEEFFFQKIYSDCGAEQIFDSLPKEVSCNDNRYCVKLDVLGMADLGDVKLD